MTMAIVGIEAVDAAVIAARDGELLAAGDGAGEKEAGDVRGGEQGDETGRGEEQQQSGSRAAHEIADKHDDSATASLLENFIDAAEKRMWFLFEAGRASGDNVK